MDFSPVSVALCLLAVCVSAADKAKSCTEVRHFYSGKGFTLNGVPNSEISGEHLRVCPQGYTCCTSAMEETLSNLSRREFEGLVREAGRSIQATLNAQYRSFDTYFLELLNGSERWLEEAFVKALGALYGPNAVVFRDLYSDLRRYYRGAALNLEEALDEFWARLLERMLKASDPAAAPLISDDFLECASKQTETLRLFGEAPRELKTRLVRVFVEARVFVQGLNMAGDVVRKVSQVPLTPECNRAIMKLVYCPHCRGLGSVKPCANYCKNVMKGCLANQADLDTEWQNLIDTMLQVASSFGTEPSMDVILHSIPVRISEAVQHMQENMELYTSKLFQACGERGEEGTPTSVSEEPKKKESTVTTLEYKPSSAAAVRLEVQVSDVSSKLKEMQMFWIQLPSALCNSKAASGSSNNDKCWNGMAKARYLPEIMGDGLANQINNPEVDIDITKPDMTIRQQIMQLKIMSNRLKNALDGNDVDFQDTSDDISGSGSGMCSEQVCVRGPPVFGPKLDRPKLDVYNPAKNKVKGSGYQIQPCISLILLLLVSLLLRR